MQALAGISGIVEIRMEGDGQAYNALILVKPDLTAIKAGLTDIGIDTGIFKFTRRTGLVVSGFTAHPRGKDRVVAFSNDGRRDDVEGGVDTLRRL